MMTIRQRIWLWLCRNRQEGTRLSRGLLVARALLFPLDFFYWRMEKTRGYDIETDTWRINGVEYSGNSLMLLATQAGDGRLFFIKRHREWGCLVVTKVGLDTAERPQ